MVATFQSMAGYGIKGGKGIFSEVFLSYNDLISAKSCPDD